MINPYGLMHMLMAARLSKKTASIWEEKGFMSAVIFVLIVLVVVFLVLLIFNAFKFPL